MHTRLHLETSVGHIRSAAYGPRPLRTICTAARGGCRNHTPNYIVRGINMNVFAAKTNSGTLRMVHHHMSSARTRSLHQAQLRSCRTQARRRHRYQHQREYTKCLPQLRGEALHVASSSMSFSISCIGMVTLRSSNARHANQGKSIPSVASSRSSSPTPAWPHCEARCCAYS